MPGDCVVYFKMKTCMHMEGFKMHLCHLFNQLTLSIFLFVLCYVSFLLLRSPIWCK